MLHESMGYESVALGHAEEDLLYLRSAVRPPSFLFPPLFLLSSGSTTSDSCFPRTHFDFIDLPSTEPSSFNSTSS